MNQVHQTLERLILMMREKLHPHVRIQFLRRGQTPSNETNVPSTPSMDMDEEGRAREEECAEEMENEEAPRRG